VLLFSAIALVAVFYVAGAWYFSGLVHDEALKAEPYDPADLQGGTIQAFDGTGEQPTVTILPDAQERDERKFDEAVVGLAVGESLLVAGPATRSPDGAQTRPVLEVIGGAPSVGERYGLTRDVWLDPEQAGLEAEDVAITTPDGRVFPAWEIPGKGAKKWAILTHGKGASRSETLRMARPLNKAGYNVLVVTYTGDVGAPAYDDGMVHYGRTEWQELQAAVDHAESKGAERIVLGGISHGGAVTLGYLARGERVSRIDGVILDSPASSFEDVIDEAAEFRSLPVINQPIPESLEDAAKLAVAFRYGVDYSAVDYSDSGDLIAVPLLTFQGVEDRTVPKAVNDRFMRTTGAGGTYEVVDGADHVLSWNVDPEAYEQAITDFTKEVSSGG
jgi:pimeloyl-ACP methyl ester carboxylesterase